VDAIYDPVAAEPLAVEVAACQDEDTLDAVEVELAVAAEVVELALSLVMDLNPPVMDVGIDLDVLPRRILDVPNEVKARDDVLKASQLHSAVAAAVVVAVVVAEH